MGAENVENLVGLSSPWEIYKKRVYNVFAQDPDVNVVEDDPDTKDGVFSFSIESGNSEKLEAIKKVLKNDIPIGNITIHINFNDLSTGDVPTADDFAKAFNGNPLFDQIVSEDLPDGRTTDYAVFNREIVDYFNDDLSDYCRNGHAIAADIVREISKDTMVGICTKTLVPDEN